MMALCCGGVAVAASGVADQASVGISASGERGVAQWIERIRAAPCVRAYAGTFVVLAHSGAMASSRISHACEGARQLERVEVLSGNPRTVFRRNDEVRTFWLHSHVARTDQREPAGVFPHVPAVNGASISQFYSARVLGQERVAGHVADVVWLRPHDSLRFGYRLWSERDTGLVVKLQTLNADGLVLEQAAFSELDLNSSVRADDLSRSMDATAGFKMETPAVVKTSAMAEGWTLRQPVAGFVPVSCHRRYVTPSEEGQGVLQCLYSDGLASVSLFLESFEPRRHPAHQQVLSMGATQVFAQRVQPDAWLTAVGEVPLQTLRLFAGQLERSR